MRTFGLTASVVGFLLIGATALVYLFTVLGEANLDLGRRYQLYADFTNASGLEPGAVVEVAGIAVGRVNAVWRVDNRARVSLLVRRDIALQEDTIASIKTRGLLGGLYVALSLGGSDRILEPGDKIRETEAPLDIPGLMSAYVAAQRRRVRRSIAHRSSRGRLCACCGGRRPVSCAPLRSVDSATFRACAVGGPGPASWSGSVGSACQEPADGVITAIGGTHL